MDIPAIILQRYDPLYNSYLKGYWQCVSHDQMRQRPHPRTNSIAWNLWHITRCEDAGINRFVFDGTQVLDDGHWLERLGVPWRHHGSEMTLAEVDELDEKINLSALQEYSQAVEKRTRALLPLIREEELDDVMQENQLRKILVDEGLAHSNPEGFIRNYLGWTKGKCLLSFCLTHSWQHLGEMEVLSSLLGVEFN